MGELPGKEMAEEIEADVVVVGAGAAGLAAASEAAVLGRRTVLLERMPTTGGMMDWAVGTVTVTNSPHQKRRGIVDSPDAHFEDLGLFAGPLAPRDNLALRRVLVDNTTEMLEWLTRLGMVFVGPMPEPPNRVPRMHNIVPNGKAFSYHLTRHCRRVGVDIRLSTTCLRLIEAGGRVVGVEARKPDGSLAQFRAGDGVVLTSGDYSSARDLKQAFASAELAEVEGIVPGSLGDGYRMALDLGAEMINGDIVRGPIMRFVPPTRRTLLQRLPPDRLTATLIAASMRVLPDFVLRPFLMSFLTTALGPSMRLFEEGAILVNKDGRRFADERKGPALAVARQHKGVAYFIFDEALARKFTAWPHFISTAPGVAYAYLADYRRSRPDIYHEASDLTGLAGSLGVPAAELERTIADHNEKQSNDRRIVRPPFHALGPVRSYVVFTEGGLRVTERHEVVRQDGSVIPGLFAAGAVGQGGLLLEGHGHHLDWAFISGRKAARNAASRETN